MKFSEIKDINKKDLMQKLFQARQNLFSLNMKHALGQLQSPLEIRKWRRDIARLKTAIQRKGDKS